jgi:hypothetical protein
MMVPLRTATANPEASHADAPSGPTRSRSPHPVFWVIAFCLVALTIRLVIPAGGSLDPAAFAQTVSGAGARGVFAFSGEISKGVNGVWMVDTDTMTIWAYEDQAQKGCLRLAASRTWRYDRYLENYNGCDLPPDVVERMVEEQRQFRLEAAEPKQSDQP